MLFSGRIMLFINVAIPRKTYSVNKIRKSVLILREFLNLFSNVAWAGPDKEFCAVLKLKFGKKKLILVI